MACTATLLEVGTEFAGITRRHTNPFKAPLRVHSIAGSKMNAQPDTSLAISLRQAQSSKHARDDTTCNALSNRLAANIQRSTLTSTVHPSMIRLNQTKTRFSKPLPQPDRQQETQNDFFACNG